MLGLTYPSRTRGALSVLKTNGTCRRTSARPGCLPVRAATCARGALAGCPRRAENHDCEQSRRSRVAGTDGRARAGGFGAPHRWRGLPGWWGDVRAGGVAVVAAAELWQPRGDRFG